MKRFLPATLMLLCSAALFSAEAAPARQDWVVAHQPDRFVDRVMMEAWADAEKSGARMELYCDTESGFRVMFLPHRDLIPEGPSRLTLTIDQAKPVVVDGDAFGDDDTDVVTIHDSGKLERALAVAHHVSVHFLGGENKTGDDAFSFGDLAAQRATLMKVCPLPKARTAP